MDHKVKAPGISPKGRWRRARLGILGACVLAAGASATALAAGSVGPGVTKPVPLAPYKPSSQVGAKPNLPRAIGYVQDSTRGFEQLLLGGLQKGAKASGLKLDDVNSNGDSQQEVQDMQQFLVTGVGAMVTAPVDPTGQAAPMVSAINDGVAMDGIVFGPAITQVNANQYAGGLALGGLAARYIKADLGGKANVVILNQDSVQPIVPRFKGVVAALKKVPGVKIIANVEPATTDNQGGFNTMNTILQEGKQVNVVLGADAVVEGAYQALQADHKLSSKQFLAGMDCEPQAIAYIEKGGAYKGCVALSPGIFAYALAEFAARWLAGKNVPEGIDIYPHAVSSVAQARAYEKADNNPGTVWNDPKQMSQYLKFYGSISYATRSKYLAYSWNPAAK